MNREQWEALARFAGAHVHHFDNAAGKIVLVDADTDDDGYHWQPDILWSDFGPLWVKLEVWLGNGTTPDQPLHSATWDFECAKMEGDEKMVMQAGCLLGAAIGATMRDKGVLAMKEQAQWVSVSERLPKDGKTVIFWIGPAEYASVGKLDVDSRCFHSVGGWVNQGDVSHWMPLPEPPTC